MGSQGLEEFIAASAERLACDCVVISDGGKFSRDIPAITYGLRGIAYYELRVTGPNRDLHSGTFGGSVTNPANALARILAAMIDDHGQGPDSRLLRRRGAAYGPRAAGVRRAAVRRGAVLRRDRRDGGDRRGRLHDRWNAAGPGRRSTSAACGAATRAKGQNGAARQGRGQVQFPPGAQPGAGEDHRGPASVAAGGHAAGRDSSS